MYEKAIVDIVSHAPKVARRIADDKDIARSGLAAAARIYALGEIPQNIDFPFVSYQEVGSEGNTDHQQSRGSLSAATVLMVVWSDNFAEAAEIRDELRDAIVGQRGTFAGETLQGVFLNQRRFDAELPADRGEHELQAATLGLTIWHNED